MIRNKKLLSIITCSILGASAFAQQTKMGPEDTEIWKPIPRMVTSPAGAPPSDALILFDGTSLGQWLSNRDSRSPAAWHVSGDHFTVTPGSGDIRTKETFSDFQLHLEWRSPQVVRGEGQGRGNSGIFLQGRYEIQILDNYDNSTYSNGQAASIYKQTMPLVNASRPPGEWQTYDIIWTAPRFNKDGMLISKAKVTVIHNGVLVQNHTEVAGTTEYIGLPRYEAHGPGPLILQDHSDTVSFRNIWIRRLD